MRIPLETRMIVLPDAEDHTIVSSFVWTKHQNVTDRKRDGRTDSLWLLQRSGNAMQLDRLRRRTVDRYASARKLHI